MLDAPETLPMPAPPGFAPVSTPRPRDLERPNHSGHQSVDHGMEARVRHRHRPATGPRLLADGVLLAVLGILILVVSAGPLAASTTGVRSVGPRPSAPFAWLVPIAAPPEWIRAVLPSGGATLSYPPSFSPLTGDAGTVSATVRDGQGRFLAYVNATPRQGDERLKGFGAFRVGLLRHEDPAVFMDAAKEGLAFRGGRGSCVNDHYVTRIDRNRYREVACLAQGRSGSAVVVAAATEATWRRFEPELRQVIASFEVR